MNFTYRFASDAEKAWMADHAVEVSEIVDFRSLAVVGEDRALTQVKAVDDAWPLVGAVGLEEGNLAQAFAPQGGLPGGVMEKILADRLGLKVGDTFKLGTQTFRLGAVLLKEPDSATAGFGLGPRTLVRTADLAQSGLLEPGSLFETEYRLVLPAGADLAATEALAEAEFTDQGMRWQDSRRAAPGVERFVERIGSFLILVGIAGLAVGGVDLDCLANETVDEVRTLGGRGERDGSDLCVLAFDLEGLGFLVEGLQGAFGGFDLATACLSGGTKGDDGGDGEELLHVI
jgi:putative ABC transport system permease protein